MTRALVAIDGEHYPPVVRDAIAALPYEVVGAWLAGGSEKLRGDADYGVPVVAELEGGFADAERIVPLLSNRAALSTAGWFEPQGRIGGGPQPWPGPWEAAILTPAR